MWQFLMNLRLQTIGYVFFYFIFSIWCRSKFFVVQIMNLSNIYNGQYRLTILSSSKVEFS